jgi:hypothetical protein
VFDKVKENLFLCSTKEALSHEGGGGVDIKIHVFFTSTIAGSFKNGERAPGTNG